MKSHKKVLSLVVALSTLLCCFANLFVKAAEIDVSGYTYVVDNMTFYNGDTQVNSLDGASEVAVDVTRRVAGGGSDRLIISTYSTEGDYIGMYSVTHHIDFGKTSNVKVLLNVPEGKTVGEVKAFVWKSFSGMTPLSNSLSSENNMTIDPRLEYEKELQTEFSDVSVNDSFADAVSLMAYLEIMNGYEDGTFRPTSNLRVADAARLITYMTKGEFLASLLEEETLVADEIPSSIERGYINYCVDSGYLAPDANGFVNYNENITVKDFLILTLNALGYSEIAAASGGWPRGYINLATELGFENLSDYTYSADITRGEAAQILAYAVNVPIVIVEGYSYTDSGELIERYVVQDGQQSQYYQSILTKNFGLYTVEGYVTATSKDGTGLKSDEISFGIASSKMYDIEELQFHNSIFDYDAILNYYERILYKVNVGDTDAQNYKGSYATVILKLDENDEWSIVKFTPSGKSTTVTFDIADLDTSNYEGSDGTLNQSYWAEDRSYLSFFKDDDTTSTKYALLYDAAYDENNTIVYVNGVNASYASSDPIWDYVINGNANKITLVDTYKTDGKYDTIHVDSYITAMVDSVTTEGKIIFSSDTVGAGSLILDAEDETVDYHIYLDGEEITVDDLKENDILSIAYDVTAHSTAASAFDYSMFYEIYVSRDVVIGELSGRDAEEYKIKIDSTYYGFASQALYNEFYYSSVLGDSFKFYIDYFGRIYNWDFDYSSIKWGIAEKFYISSADDDYKLTIFTADGTTKTYYFDATRATVTVNGAYYTSSNSDLTEIVSNAIYSSYPTKTDITNRVIQYKISSSTGKIRELKFIECSAGSDYAEEFKSRTNSIGAVRLSSQTKIIDACYYYSTGLSTLNLSDLYDGASYYAYGYGDRVDGAYLFTLITNASVSTAKYAMATDFIQGTATEDCSLALYEINVDDYNTLGFKAETKIITADNDELYAEDYLTVEEFSDELKDLLYDENGTLLDAKDRIVSYRISYEETGLAIEEIKFLPYTSSVTTMTAYDADTNTIGSISLSDNAFMVDISVAEEEGIYTYAPQYFTDGRKCKAYAYDIDSDGKYPLVLITEADVVNTIQTGIVENFTKASSDDYYKLTFFTDDGETEQYYFDDDRADVVLHTGSVVGSYGSELTTAVQNIIYDGDYYKSSIVNRVVKYKLHPTTRRVTYLEFMTPMADTLSGTNGRMEYSEGNKTIGDIILDDTTKIINALWGGLEEVCSASLDDLYDGTSYEAYAYGEMTDGAYPFVLITMANISDSAYAIAEAFTTATTIDATEISLYDINDDYTRTLSFDATDTKISFADGTTKYTADYASVSDFCYKMSALTSEDVSLTDRIVSYRLNYDTSCFEEITFIPVSKKTEEMSQYNATTKTIGDISLTDDALIIDNSELGFGIFYADDYIDGIECEAAFYNADDDGKYSLAVITAIGEVPVVTPNYAIAEKFTLSSADDEYKLTMFTADGATKSYYVDSKVTTYGNLNTILANMYTDWNADTFTGTQLSPIEYRVITYKVSSSTGKITSLNFVEQSANTYTNEYITKQEYNATKNTIGSIKLDENTKIIDATEYAAYGDLYVETYAGLSDGEDYKAFAYGEKVDDAYPLVLITEGASAYNKNTRFAVVTQDGAAEEEDAETGNIIYVIEAMYGDAEELLVSDDVSTSELASLKKGDVIYFRTNRSGLIDDIDKILSFGSSMPTQYELAQNSLVANNTNYDNLIDITIPTAFNYNFSADFTTEWESTDADAIRVIYGPVLERTDDYIIIGEIDENGMTNLSTSPEFYFASDVNVYTYDYSLATKYKFGYSASSVSAIAPSYIADAYLEEDGDTVDWSKTVDGEYVNQQCVNFAFAVVVEDEIVDIFATIAK